MSLNYDTSRPTGSVIRLIVLHTNQGPHLPNQHPDHTAEALTTYLTSTANTNNPVSYHVVVDDDSLIEYLPDKAEAWAALASNSIGLHLCFIGMAEWERSTWLEHKPMLKLAAKKVLQWTGQHSIPITKRSPVEIAHDAWGIIGHGDWTKAQKIINPKALDSHTDPGPNFPWDVFIFMVHQLELDIQGQPTNMEVENFQIPPGKGLFPIGCTVGKSSSIVKQAWVSAFLNGNNDPKISSSGTIRFWFQDDKGGISDISNTLTFNIGHSSRFWVTVPDGTTMIRCDYNFPDGGVITLEAQSK